MKLILGDWLSNAGISWILAYYAEDSTGGGRQAEETSPS